MPSIELVTFAAGAKWVPAAKRLSREAASTKIFEKVTRAGSRSILSNKLTKALALDQFMLNNPRGFGYWIWKPLLIADTLRNTNSDFVVYLDSGCTLNTNPAAIRRFNHYLDLANSSATGVLGFQMNHPEHFWTKADLLNRLDATADDRQSGQLMGGVNIWRRHAGAEEFANMWLEICMEDSMHYLDDSSSHIANHSGFVEHRHDQSVFSLLMKTTKSTYLSDETYFAPDWPVEAEDFPIWTTRHPSILPFSKTTRNPAFELLRKVEAMAQERLN